MHQLRAGAYSGGIQIGILMDLDRAIAPIVRRNQAPAVLQFGC